jgi:hypothetical protein
MTTCCNHTVCGATPQEPMSLVRPQVDIEALASFLDVGANLFADLVESPHEVFKAERLSAILLWSMRYRASVRQHGGLVDESLDVLAPTMLVESINIVYGQ